MMEENIIIKLAQAGNERAKEEMYNKYLQSINSITWRFRHTPHFSYEDFFQVGCIGFVKAIKGFDAKLGFKFMTYLYPKIEGEILRYTRDNKGAMKHSRGSMDNFSKMRKMKRNGCSEERISEELNISMKEIEDLEIEFNKNLVFSLDKKLNSGSSSSFLEQIGGEETIEESELLYIKEAIDELNDKQKEVIIRFFFKDETQQEISKSLGTSQAQVSRIITKSVKILKKYMEV